ncbi:hypothetical protein GW17_00050071 [Ensete ventricosum]|nr:hypothetical protein GW17_00050071 [Ensete ventricosum]
MTSQTEWVNSSTGQLYLHKVDHTSARVAGLDQKLKLALEARLRFAPLPPLSQSIFFMCPLHVFLRWWPPCKDLINVSPKLGFLDKLRLPLKFAAGTTSAGAAPPVAAESMLRQLNYGGAGWK